MLPSKWGSYAWTYLHAVTFDYPENPDDEIKSRYENFFNCIILPCSICDISYDFLKVQFPIKPYLKDRGGIVYWLYWIHNLVNLKLKKKLPEFSSIVYYYEEMRVGCKDKNSSNSNNSSDKCTSKKSLTPIDEFINNTIDRYEKITNDTIKKILSNSNNNDRTDIANIREAIKEYKFNNVDNTIADIREVIK